MSATFIGIVLCTDILFHCGLVHEVCHVYCHEAIITDLAVTFKSNGNNICFVKSAAVRTTESASSFPMVLV